MCQCRAVVEARCIRLTVGDPCAGLAEAVPSVIPGMPTGIVPCRMRSDLTPSGVWDVATATGCRLAADCEGLLGEVGPVMLPVEVMRRVNCGLDGADGVHGPGTAGVPAPPQCPTEDNRA
mmetsp:Transcript_41665/g.97707  ORF Transcript_41665/g.97707 Transcript_41665/m.97707 type:complete len:120 (-) Transcript_41665:2291-2650(-)